MKEIKFKPSPKKIVPRWLAFIVSWGYFLDAILIIIALLSGWVFDFINYVTDKSGTFPVSFVVTISVILLSALFFWFCSNHFEWSVNPVFIIKDDCIVFKTDDVIAALGRATTTYKIKYIENLKVKKTSVIVEGKIEVQAPLEKKKVRNACEIVCLYDYEDKKEVIEALTNFKDKS